MSFKLTHNLPNRCLVAVSGGVDSASALHWLSQVKDRVAGVIHIHHNTGEFADKAQELVEQTVKEHPENISLHVYRINRDPEEGSSLENFWRQQRYRFFQAASIANNNLPVVLAHNLDDCLEEYIMCTMIRGFAGTIPYQHRSCIRPFRRWKKKDICRYADRNDIKFLTDPSNSDTRYKRNFVRLNIVDKIRTLNPGIYNIVEKAIQDQDNHNQKEST